MGPTSSSQYEPVEVSGDEKDPLGDAWEEEWLNWAEAEAKRLQDQGSNLRISYFATRSFADEFGAVIDNDVTLIQVRTVQRATQWLSPLHGLS